jgi:polysaccharide export outer membrane protein
MSLRILNSLLGVLCIVLLVTLGATQAHAQVAKQTPSDSTPAEASNPIPQSPPASADKTDKTDKTKGQPATAENLADYTIGEQDSLMIVVWKEPELSGPAVVRPDGKITVPLANEVYVIGLTPLQLQNLLMEKLKPLVNAAQVTVTVRDIKSYKVYLIGQVARQGEFQINNSTTVFQVIAEAGGLSEFAKRKKIYVLRNVNGKQVRYPFNYDEVIQGKNIQQNIGLQRGDTIVVP